MTIKKKVLMLEVLVVISLAIITFLSVKLAHVNNKNITHIKDVEFKMFDMAWKVKYLDEVLTHSVARYIQTKDSSWLDRYDKYAGQLDEVLATIEKTNPKAWKYFEDTSSANDKLIAYETEIFEKVDANQKDEAKSIFYGDYERQKEILLNGLSKFFENQNSEITLFIENTLKENNSMKWITIISAIVISIFIILIGVMGIKSLISRLTYFEETMSFIAKNRDFSKSLSVDSKDEITNVMNNFGSLISELQNLISNIKNSSNETASIANELSATAENIGKRVEEEVAIVEETVKDGERDKDLLNISLQTSKDTKDDIEKSNKNLEEAKKDILTMISQVQESSRVEEELSQKLNQLSSDAEAVKGVLTVIADIADQTNLLALNAAIEAARAGEHGRGFAVVADEVRQLAERTQKSLTEINSTINVIVQSIVDVSEQMNVNAKDIQNLSKVSDEVEHKINETADLMIQSANTANKSLDNTTEIVNNYQDRIKKIESINELSNSNARSLEETISATEHLNQMTEELNSKLNEFKT